MEIVSFEYSGGVNPDLDFILDQLASAYGGQRAGGGQLMLPPYVRDIAYDIPHKYAQKFKFEAAQIIHQYHIGQGALH